MNDRLIEIVKELEKNNKCNCDLDNWQPERNTGHSHVCRIHTQAVSKFRVEKNLGT